MADKKIRDGAAVSSVALTDKFEVDTGADTHQYATAAQICASVFVNTAPTLGWYSPSADNIRTPNSVTIDDVLTVTGKAFIGGTSNANSTLGLTIDQLGNDDQILCWKSTGDITTGLTTAVLGTADVDTATFFIGEKRSATNGGVLLIGLGGTGSTLGTFEIQSYGGAPTTTDTSASVGPIALYCAQHDGANALVDMAANSNAITIGEIDSGGNRLTRFALKADDGELHLGNTTLVALDGEDDVMLVRAMQKESASSGIIETEYDNPFYNYEKLHAVGLAGEKDDSGFFLFPLQPRLHAYEGALWQNYCRLRRLEERFLRLEGPRA